MSAGGFRQIRRIIEFLQRYVVAGQPQVIGRPLGPGTRVGVMDSIDKMFFGIMGVPAGDGAKSVFACVINRIQHHIFSKITVEALPAFGILGHVHGSGAQFDPYIMHHLKGFYKSPALGHDFIKKITVGDEQSLLYAVILLDVDVA